MSIDTSNIRAQFPILERKIYGRPLVYLDNAASSQVPNRVVEAISTAYTHAKANVHRGNHLLSQEATDAMELGRIAAARLINAPSRDEIIFTRGTTEALNLVATTVGETLNEGDEVIVSAIEHHSNIVPWHLLSRRKGIAIKVIPVLADGSLDLEAYADMLSPRTRIVSVCHASNVLGTINPVKQMAKMAHGVGALFCVDGAQSAPHSIVDVQDIDCDLFAFSAHKVYGPTGIGILYGRRNVLEQLPPYQGGGEMIGHVHWNDITWADIPFKFEAGTPDYIGAAAMASAVEFVEEVGMSNIAAHEHELAEYARQQMASIPGMRFFGNAAERCGVISFLIGKAHHYDTGMLLDKMGIAVRTGHHCAQPLMDTLGVEGTVRASFAVYNTAEEVDTFVAALRRIAPLLDQ
ncbi:MAG: aminotransferase class V-fold PLP-dependent enzyme [Muribaculaceae bacterium]